MLRLRFSLCCLVSCLLLQSCAAPGMLDASADRSAIEQIRQRIRNAELAGDASVFGQVAVADVVVMPPGAAPIVGRDATVTAMQGFFRDFELRIDYVAAPVEVRGDTAIDHGTFTQSIVPKSGAAPRPGSGSYLWVYRRTAGGKWLQTHAIWNVK
jgi:uncharacterized protein (TIGR02246 family)